MFMSSGPQMPSMASQITQSRGPCPDNDLTSPQSGSFHSPSLSPFWPYLLLSHNPPSPLLLCLECFFSIIDMDHPSFLWSPKAIFSGRLSMTTLFKTASLSHTHILFPAFKKFSPSHLASSIILVLFKFWFIVGLSWLECKLHGSKDVVVFIYCYVFPRRAPGWK